jgi:hypothetical protein
VWSNSIAIFHNLSFSFPFQHNLIQIRTFLFYFSFPPSHTHTHIYFDSQGGDFYQLVMKYWHEAECRNICIKVYEREREKFINPYSFPHCCITHFYDIAPCITFHFSLFLHLLTLSHTFLLLLIIFLFKKLSRYTQTLNHKNINFSFTSFS